MFEGKLNLETELITAVTWFLICTLVHSVSLLVSFLCLEMIPGQCVHELISLYLSTSQVPSPAHLSQPSSLQDNPLVLDLIERGCCGGGRGVWWAGDMRVSQPSRSGALLSFPYFLFSPDFWKLESIGKYSRYYSRQLGEISITSDMQMTPPLWQKVKRN